MSVRRPILALLVVAMLASMIAPSAAATAPDGRLGLHVTTAELAEWRTRATSGPYRSSGDVSTNSPGDWQRIVANSAAFRSAPSANRWGGPADVTGCVDGSTSGADQPTVAHSRNLRDAAFHALVTGDRELRRLVAGELYAQSRVATLRFSDRSHWCLGKIWDLNPGFEIANWLTTLLYVHEYVEIGDRLDGTSSLTVAQRHEVLDWMFAAAEWMNHDNDVKLAYNFTDRTTRSAPPYTLTSHRASTPDYKAEPYAGAGNVVGAIARYYNNRRAATQRFVGLLGLHLVHRTDGYTPPASPLGYTPQRYVADSTKFAKDFLVYSAYPQGFVGEFERWQDRLPDLGWAYAMQALAPVMTYVDALARTGDTSLYGFATTAGVHHTEGAPSGASAKTWGWLVRSLVGYVDGTHVRYTSGSAGVDGYRIEGLHTASGWEGIHDVALVPTTRYWTDGDLAGVLARTAPGTRPYPARPAGFGQYSPWNGDWGTLAGVLFMFGDMEHLPSPYTGAAATEPVVSEPAPEPEPEPAPSTKPGKGNGRLKKAVEISSVCPLGLSPTAFVDVLGNVHATAIECVAARGIAQGLTVDRYGPERSVSRGQMASFLTRLIEDAGGELPAADGTGFADTVGTTHADSVARLAAAGIVSGVDAQRFAPHATVTRGQLASFLARTLEHLGTAVPDVAPDAFADDDGSVHEAAIDAIAELAILTGTVDGTVQPGVPVRRDQTASFLARTLAAVAAA